MEVDGGFVAALGLLAATGHKSFLPLCDKVSSVASGLSYPLKDHDSLGEYSRIKGSGASKSRLEYTSARSC